MKRSRPSVISARRPAVALLALTAAAACRTKPPAQARASIELPAPVAHARRESAFDVQRYSLDLELDPAERRIRGTCRILLWPRSGTLATVELDLDDLAVASVRDEQGRSLPFERQPGALRIPLAEPLRPGTCTELGVEYGGTPRKGLYFGAERDGVPTQVFTQGECEDARGWFPCFDDPADRATSELRVTMPAAWRAVAAGERI